MATVIVKFLDNKIKKYHKGCSCKIEAKIAIEKMIREVKMYLDDIEMFGIIWNGKDRPWREKDEKISKIESKHLLN